MITTRDDAERNEWVDNRAWEHVENGNVDTYTNGVRLALSEIAAHKEHQRRDAEHTAPSKVQVERARILDRTAQRHMRDSGCDYATGVKRALSEHLMVAHDYEKGDV